MFILNGIFSGLKYRLMDFFFYLLNAGSPQFHHFFPANRNQLGLCKSSFLLLEYSVKNTSSTWVLDWYQN